MGKIPSIDETPKLSEFVPSSSDVKSDVVTRGDVLPDVTDDGFSITKAISDFIDGFKEGFMEVFDNIAKFFGFGDDTPDTPTVQDTREYGLQECSDAAKEIFTPEVLSRWGLMDLQERQDKRGELQPRQFPLPLYFLQCRPESPLLSYCWLKLRNRQRRRQVFARQD